ncbi:hypothetical protein [Stenotrophomonas sp. GD03657]|uniref:hypothetical protein n=1 Tax=Stenotrophomonas sp. GD03657 TaxID=2975363 RepID=UPI002447A6A6|nr:hypothetical protein [Stenotrophomonas sp. GD03657]MDH2154356.1 hypothetical protein [Stenotrophomonas sp. GD03657]
MVEDLAAVRKEPMSFDAVAIELATLYETKYGLFNHGDPYAKRQRPLALAALHPKEDASRYSPLYARIDKYRRLKIYSATGLSLTEFLNLPRDIVEEILRQTERDAAVEASHVDKVSHDLDKIMGKK